MVPKKGLEPPHPCEYMDLNHARLPIPPLRHYVAPDQTRRCDGKYSSILKGLLNVSNPGRRQSPGSAALKRFQSYCILLHHAQSPAACHPEPRTQHSVPHPCLPCEGEG